MTNRNPKKGKPNIITRWLYYKWSGAITVPIVLVSILLPWGLYVQSLDFYDEFSCNGLIIYKINNKPLGENPTYNNLTEEGKSHYDSILEQCRNPEFDRHFYHKQFVGLGNQEILDNKIVATEVGSMISEHGDFGE